MPPPLRNPFADGLVPPGDVEPEPSYLYFLQHSRLDEEHNLVLNRPAQGQSQGASPPLVDVDHEASPASSSHGERTSGPSTPLPSTKQPVASVEAAPARLDAATEHQPREKEKQSAAPAWHCSASAGDDVDEDYHIFMQHTLLVDGQLVFEIDGGVLNYDKRRVEEVDSPGGTLGVGGDRKWVALASPATPVPSTFEIGGRAVNYDQPVAARSGANVEAEKKRGKRRAEEVDSPGGTVGVGGEREGVALRSPAPPVPRPYSCDWQADPIPAQEDEGPSHAAAAGTVKKEKGVYWEASSSNGRAASLPSVSGKVEKEPGVIWPPYITQRPDSDFKRRLIEVLTKPASRKEYYKLFDMVTVRKPLVKMRQVRGDSKFYPTEEMGSSYLDHYPELADQIMKTGSRRGLALMRGFFFWLQNSCHEDQFIPWAGGSEGPEVIPLAD